MTLTNNKKPLIMWSSSGKYFYVDVDEKDIKIEIKKIKKEKEIDFGSLKKTLSSISHEEIIIDDRILGDALTPKFLKNKEDAKKYLKEFKELREILSKRNSNSKLYLNTIKALPLDSEPLFLDDDNIFFTLLKYIKEKKSEITLEPTKDKDDIWTIDLENFNAEISMEPWYYRKEFVETRNNVDIKWQSIDDIFEIHVPEKKQPSKAIYNTNNDNLKLAWISTPQISLDSNSIIIDRISEYVENIDEYFKLKDNDILICLARRTDIKMGKFKEDLCGKATAARYIKILRLKDVKKNDIDKLMASLKSQLFINQIRMYLSNRCYKPITEYILKKIKIPPSNLSDNDIQLSVAISDLVSCKKENIKESFIEFSTFVKNNQFSDQFMNNNLFDYLRFLHKLLFASNQLEDKYFVIGSDLRLNLLKKIKDKLIENGLNKKNTYIIQISKVRGKKMIEIAKCKRAYLLTYSHLPLRATGEYETYRNILKILGHDHVFVLVNPQEEAEKYPGRRLIEHMFIDDLYGENFLAIEYDQNLSKFTDIEKIEKKEFTDHQKYAEVLDSLEKVCNKNEYLKTYESPVRNLRLKIIEKMSGNSSFEMLDGGFQTVNKELIQLRENFKTLINNGEKVILIEGESGVGKGLFCKEVLNDLLKDPLIAGCQLSETLALSQLFGHMKGAFTGATEDKKGYVTIAEKEGMPLILDEINSYPLSIQWQLLMLLQDGKYEILGEPGEYKDFNQICVCISNQSIKTLTDEKKFRFDLAMRLGHPLIIPPLRERLDDLNYFIDNFKKEIIKRKDRKTPSFKPEVAKYLLEYKWPGNVRELKNIIRRIVILGKDEEEITLDFLKKLFPDMFKTNYSCNIPYVYKLLEEQLEKKENKGDIYQKIIKETGGKKSSSDNLSKWVKKEHRKKDIESHAEYLPQSNSYLNSLKESSDTKHKKGS